MEPKNDFQMSDPSKFVGWRIRGRLRTSKKIAAPQREIPRVFYCQAIVYAATGGGSTSNNISVTCCSGQETNNVYVCVPDLCEPRLS